jgi:Domain of unknown function (DUF4402)
MNVMGRCGGGKRSDSGEGKAQATLFSFGRGVPTRQGIAVVNALLKAARAICMRVMRIASAFLATLLFAPGVARAQQCRLCSAQPDPVAQAQPVRPIKIDIETALDFSTAAHTDLGQGSIQIDPLTGQRRFSGLIGVGGPALRGKVTIQGEPFRRVRIELPTTIRLNATMGAKAEVTDFQSTLGPNPMIGADGQLVFWIGGKLSVLDDAAGEFHGRIHISADYQ